MKEREVRNETLKLEGGLGEVSILENTFGVFFLCYAGFGADRGMGTEEHAVGLEVQPLCNLQVMLSRGLGEWTQGRSMLSARSWWDKLSEVAEEDSCRL